MDTAWIAVVGSLGGVLIGGLLNVVMEQQHDRREDRRWEHERSTLFHDRQRELAAQLPALLWEVRSRAWSYVDYRKSEPGWRHDSYVQAQQDRLEEASSAFKRGYYELAILGMSDSLTRAALELWAWDGFLMTQGFRDLTGPEMANLEFDDDLWTKEIDAFVAAAAADLGAVAVTPGTTPQA